MIRNLKALIGAAIALTIFGNLSGNAQAAEEKFHCSVEPCRATLAPDETAGTATAHHVLVVKGKTTLGGAEGSFSITCPQLMGEAKSTTKTAIEVTLTNLKYVTASGFRCQFAGSESFEINFTSCDYGFKSTGGSTSTAGIHVLCTTAGDGIDLRLGGVLCVQITPFTSTGIGYHDAGVGGAKKVVTATANVAIPPAAVDLKNVGDSHCSSFGLSTVTSASYTTGNTLVKAETDSGGVTAEAWFE